MESVILGARFAVAVVLVLAGAAKARRAGDLAGAIDGYRILPRRWSRAVAAGLPWVELACGLGLALGFATRVVAAFVVVLLAAFTAAVTVSLVRGLQVDCGCFGAAQGGRAGGWTVTRNLVLLAAAVAVTLRPPATLALWPAAAGGLPGGDGLAVLVTVTALYLAGAVAWNTALSLRIGRPEDAG